MTIRDAAGSKAAKQKGRDAENAVVEYLRSVGIPAERRRQKGVVDCGDVGAWDGVMVEVKNERRINLSGYLKEVEVQTAEAHARFTPVGRKETTGCAVVKKRGTTDAGDWYAVVPFRVMVELLR